MQAIVPYSVPSVETGKYELTVPLSVWALGEEWFTVPTGFCSDGASIPRLLWRAVGTPFQPAFLRAAFAHDWAYRMGLMTRARADELFRVMLVDDLGRAASWVASQDDSSWAARARARFRAAVLPWAMWAGVRAGGWRAWRKYRRAA